MITFCPGSGATFLTKETGSATGDYTRKLQDLEHHFLSKSIKDRTALIKKEYGIEELDHVEIPKQGTDHWHSVRQMARDGNLDHYLDSEHKRIKSENEFVANLWKRLDFEGVVSPPKRGTLKWEAMKAATQYGRFESMIQEKEKHQMKEEDHSIDSKKMRRRSK